MRNIENVKKKEEEKINRKCEEWNIISERKTANNVKMWNVMEMK